MTVWIPSRDDYPHEEALGYSEKRTNDESAAALLSL